MSLTLSNYICFFEGPATEVKAENDEERPQEEEQTADQEGSSEGQEGGQPECEVTLNWSKMNYDRAKPVWQKNTSNEDLLRGVRKSCNVIRLPPSHEWALENLSLPVCLLLDSDEA